jgi:hypothetical protein
VHAAVDAKRDVEDRLRVAAGEQQRDAGEEKTITQFPRGFGYRDARRIRGS